MARAALLVRESRLIPQVPRFRHRGGALITQNTVTLNVGGVADNHQGHGHGAARHAQIKCERPGVIALLVRY